MDRALRLSAEERWYLADDIAQGNHRLSSVPSLRLDFDYGLTRVTDGGGWVLNALSRIAF